MPPESTDQHGQCTDVVDCDPGEASPCQEVPLCRPKIGVHDEDSVRLGEPCEQTQDYLRDEEAGAHGEFAGRKSPECDCLVDVARSDYLQGLRIFEVVLGHDSGAITSSK